MNNISLIRFQLAYKKNYPDSKHTIGRSFLRTFVHDSHLVTDVLVKLSNMLHETKDPLVSRALMNALIVIKQWDITSLQIINNGDISIPKPMTNIV